MFEHLLRELATLNGARVELPIQTDEDGYLDRECPQDHCKFEFKVLLEDWKAIVRDEEVFCPSCRHAFPATGWVTEQQVRQAKEQAHQHIHNVIGSAMRRDAASVNGRARLGQFLTITMKVDGPPQRMLVPITATEPMRLRATCKACRCRYSYVGSAFFCPSCGRNSAEETFRASLDAVNSTLGIIDTLRTALSRDDAEVTARFLREKAVSDLVTSIQHLGECLYDRIGGLPAYKRNAFQRLDDASELWSRATGASFWSLLGPGDESRLKLHYQRRHLLAHSQGVVDDEYVKKSGDSNYRVGQRVVINEDSVRDFLRIARNLGEGLISTSASVQLGK